MNEGRRGLDVPLHSHQRAFIGVDPTRRGKSNKRSSLLWIPVEKTDVAYKDLSFFSYSLSFSFHPGIYHTYLSFRCVLSSSIIVDQRGGEGNELRSNHVRTHTHIERIDTTPSTDTTNRIERSAALTRLY